MKKIFLTVVMIAVSLSSAIAQTNGVTPQTQMLLDRNAEFTPEIINIAPNVYTASGYDASNITMIVGDDGVVIIDAGKFPNNTERVYAEFRKITDKPIKGIIITHGHGDHSGGIAPLLADNTPRIWAAENFGDESDFPEAAGFKNPRSYHQSGMLVSPELRINNGVAPTVYPNGAYNREDKEGVKSLYVPFTKELITDFVSESKSTIQVAGITLELERTYGETDDHLVVWYPAERVIFPGDQFYKSFPNLYAIRGTAYRDVQKWIAALNTILSYDAEAMAQGHTRPIVGADSVKSALTAHRDAVQFVFEKSIDGMNMGMTPDQLVEYVTLPKELASDPNLVEFYGRVEYAVRNIFSGYLGWYDGNPTTLRPLSPRAEAEHFVSLVGGESSLLKIAQQAFVDGEYQWCCELTDRLLALDSMNSIYRNLKADALIELALRIETATTRNYYNSVAQELREE